MFYYPTHSTRIVKTKNAKFIENGEENGSTETRNVIIQEERVQILLPSTSNQIVVPPVIEPSNKEEQLNDQQLPIKVITNEQIIEEPQGIAIRRSQRKRRFAISDDYVVYL